MLQFALNMLISEKIRDWLGAGAKVEPTGDLANGDYATNLALVTKRDAQELAQELEKSKPAEIGKIEVAGPGFINFTLTREYLAQNLRDSLEQKDKFGWDESLRGKKVLVEYTDPNPFKEFHIGHLMSNAVGESISRLIESRGAEVKRACYSGDVGLHVAKAIWWLRQSPGNFLKAYAEGHKSYETDENAKKEIIAINKKLYDRSDSAINLLYSAGLENSLEYFELIYKKLGTMFDYYFLESEVADFGKQLVQENTGKIFEESDGAVVFHAENYDKKLHTRVFINSDGLPTYEAKELGLAKIKFDKFNYDESIIITANEVDQYFRVLLKALEQIFPELAAKTKHISHGFLRLSTRTDENQGGPSKKMSSRTGDVITAESLLAQVGEQVRAKNADAPVDDIAVAAIKFEILKQAPGRDVIFDINKSVSLEGDSGPYLQYTYARAWSVLEKSAQQSDLADLEISEPARLLARYPDIAERAAETLAPQMLIQYLLQLASSYNSYYAQKKIIGSEQEKSRLALTQAVAQVLKNGLWLLGIKAPEKM